LLPLVLLLLGVEAAELEERVVAVVPLLAWVLLPPLEAVVLLPPLEPVPPVLTEAELFRQVLEPVPIELEMADEAEAPVLSTT
jgi:hypothetical protein